MKAPILIAGVVGMLVGAALYHGYIVLGDRAGNHQTAKEPDRTVKLANGYEIRYVKDESGRPRFFHEGREVFPQDDLQFVPSPSGKHVAWWTGKELHLYDLQNGMVRTKEISGYIENVKWEGDDLVVNKMIRDGMVVPEHVTIQVRVTN